MIYEIVYYVVPVSVVAALALQIILLVWIQKKKHKQLEENLLKNAIQLVKKMDELEENLMSKGGSTMNEDMKKLAAYLAGKIEKAKEEILEQLDGSTEEVVGKIDELGESPKEKEEPEEDEALDEDKDSYDELDEYEGDRSVSFEDAMADIEDKKKKGKKKG